MSTQSKVSVKWDQKFRNYCWEPVGSFVEHGSEVMAEFQVIVDGVPDDVERANAEHELAVRLAVLLDLAAGISTDKLCSARFVP